MIVICIVITLFGTFLSLHEFNNKSYNTVKKIIATVFMVGPGYFLYVMDKAAEEKKERYQSNVFVIDTTKVTEAKSVCVDIGGTKFYSVNSTNQTFFDILDPLNVNIVNGTLRFSFTIRDIDENILCSVENNVIVASDNSSILDKNFDNNAFEIINKKNDVVFQAELKDSCVKLCFITGRGNRQLIMFAYSLIIPLSDNNLPFKFEKLFKYPSSLYPGVRNVINKSTWLTNLNKAEDENNDSYQYACLSNLMEIDSNDINIRKKFISSRILGYVDSLTLNNCYKYLESDPTNFDINFAFARRYFGNRPDSSLIYLNRCLKINPNYGKGICHFYFALMVCRATNRDNTPLILSLLEKAFKLGFKIELLKEKSYAYDLFNLKRIINDKRFINLCNKYHAFYGDIDSYFIFIKDKEFY